MTKRSFVFGIFLTFFCCSLMWAGGNRDANQSRSADDVSGFTDTIDISDLKPGTYNYYLEARDRAGNITLSGPENITIDPASDLPGVNIINPVVNMHVQGNLNIVGIAFDDDGIDHVEILVQRGNGSRGEEVLRARAQGTDYWSYFLDTSNNSIWRDGVYTITAWAVDKNGLSGISEQFSEKQHKKSSVFWRLDRGRPEIIVTSHETGALVSGNIRLRGTAADGNGINSFGYSIDNGSSYRNVRLRSDRNSGLYNWEINLNTRQFNDGPVVIWLQGHDEYGTKGVATHLLYVNNTGPQVTIVHPAPDTVVNGLFSIAGFAQHPVGLKKVTWKAGNARGEFELLPGNHWWSADIDIRGLRMSNIDIEIRAEDISGNVTNAKRRYRVNQNEDLPVITLIDPAPGIIDGSSITVRGNAHDDDGVSSIFYSLNAADPVEMPCSGYFQFQISSIPEGANTLEIWAKDITGVQGNKVQVRGITVLPKLPVPSVVSFTTGTGRAAVTDEFYTGMTFIFNPRTTIQIKAASNASPVSCFVSIGDAPPVSVRLSGSREIFTGSVQIPAQMPNGLKKIQIALTDRYGREVVYDDYFYLINPIPLPDSTEVQIPVLQPSFTWIRPNIISDGRILLTPLNDTLMGITPVPLISAEITAQGDHFLFTTIDEYGRLVLSSNNTGDSGEITLTLTDRNNRTFESGPYEVLSDLSEISVFLREPLMDRNVFAQSDVSSGFLIETKQYQNSFPLKFNLISRLRLKTLEISKDMGDTWQNLASYEEVIGFGDNVNLQIEKTIDISSVADGLITILIKAVNESGQTSITEFEVIKDTQPPQAALVVPYADSHINGAVKIGFVIKESANLASVRYYRPANSINEEEKEINVEVFDYSSWNKNYRARFLEVLTDPVNMPLDENMRFIFTDMAGNTFEIASWPFIIDQELDVPTAQIVLPVEGELITSDFIISGIMYDDDAIKQIYWRMDDGEEITLIAENGFTIPVSISSLSDNEHCVTVIAEDIFGVKSAPVTRKFMVSLAEPSAELMYPSYDTVLKDIVEITGSAYDENGILSLQISIDNGNTFNTVFGEGFGTLQTQAKWSYRFNTKILRDGPHVVFIRVWDGYGSMATYANMINIDNTPPAITLESPIDGSVTVGNIYVMGRINDENLENISIEIKSLENKEMLPGLSVRELEPSSIIRELFDFSAQEDGHYNITVAAVDRAGNVTRSSSNFEVAKNTHQNYIEILYPLDNEELSGEFNIYGYSGGSGKAETVTIRVNGRDLVINAVEPSGYFNFNLYSEQLLQGKNIISVHSNFSGSEQVFSKEHTILYSRSGPWVTIDNFSFGAFAYDRPYIYGRTGYVLSEEDEMLLADKSTERSVREAISLKSPALTEISFDNGRTFTGTLTSRDKNIDYRYRLETGELTEGSHYIIVKTTMQNGETAVTRMLVQVDKTPPVIQLISPEISGRYNEQILFSATASDDVELVSLTYHLRAGDKFSYEVPGFMKGLYIEGIIPPFIRQAYPDVVPVLFSGGVTYTDFGIGLSVFDDNVKIQFLYGFMTQDIFVSLGGRNPPGMRYGGNVIGIKLLANLYNLPFGSFAGPNWEWLSASFAVGANFSLFDFTQNGNPTWLSALLAQIEFPKVTIRNRKFLRTFSMFTEGQLWFVATDVNAAANNIPVVLPKVVMGLRLYVF